MNSKIINVIPRFWLIRIFIDMKIIINENRLNKIIGKWLNKEYSDLNVDYHDTEPYVLYVNKKGEITFLYQTKSNELYVPNEIIKFFYVMFSIDIEQTKDILGEWFEEYTGLIPVKVMGWDFEKNWRKNVRWVSKKRLDN